MQLIMLPVTQQISRTRAWALSLPTSKSRAKASQLIDGRRVPRATNMEKPYTVLRTSSKKDGLWVHCARALEKLGKKTAEEKDAKISSFMLAQDDVEAPPVPGPGWKLARPK